MCMPLGPRRNSTSRRSCSSRISKSSVEEMICSGEYESCLYKMDFQDTYGMYEGCRNNLLMILHDPETTVKVATKRDSEYVEEYKTIIMKAPCFPAKIIFRLSK